MPVKSKTAKKDDNNKPIYKILIGSVIGSVLYFLLIALFSLMALKSSFDSSVYMPAGIVLGGLSAFLGGFITVKPIKEKGVFYGALTGLIQALICASVLFIVNNATAGTGIFILIAVILLCGALGGVAAVNIKKKIKY